MAKIQFLTILLVVTCFLGSVVSVTDKEFEVCSEAISGATLLKLRQMFSTSAHTLLQVGYG